MTISILIILAVSAVILAGLFAGTETGVYQLSRIRLRLGIAEKKLSFIILGKSLSDSPGLLISMLIGTNLLYYITTSIVTFILLSRLQDKHAVEILTAVITTPIVFIFSEVIPKSLFLYRADFLMPFTAPVVFVFHKLCTFCGIVPLLKGFSRLLGRFAGSASMSNAAIASTQRHQISTLLQETREEKVLSSIQTGIISRMTNISNITIHSVMILLNKVQMVEVNSNRDALLNILKKSAYTRLPVYEDKPGNIVGFINIYDALNTKEDFDSLHSLVKPIHRLSADISVLDAMNIVQKEKQKIVLVNRLGLTKHHRPLGIVTMKDLIEELFGELTEW
ncbi:MAG: CNNM domain-containing protein [Planctomycetota bacterium]|jgi:CBS domain containing-hemolysin-like protein